MMTMMGASDALVTLQITPAVQLAPGKVMYHMRISPHRDNVWMCFGWDNIETLKSRTSCQQLNGIYSPRYFQQEYTWLEAGHYSGFLHVYRAPQYLADMAAQEFIID